MRNHGSFTLLFQNCFHSGSDLRPVEECVLCCLASCRYARSSKVHRFSVTQLARERKSFENVHLIREFWHENSEFDKQRVAGADNKKKWPLIVGGCGGDSNGWPTSRVVAPLAKSSVISLNSTATNCAMLVGEQVTGVEGCKPISLTRLPASPLLRSTG